MRPDGRGCQAAKRDCLEREERRGADEQFLLSNPRAWQINNQQSTINSDRGSGAKLPFRNREIAGSLRSVGFSLSLQEGKVTMQVRRPTVDSAAYVTF